MACNLLQGLLVPSRDKGKCLHFIYYSVTVIRVKHPEQNNYIFLSNAFFINNSAYFSHKLNETRGIIYKARLRDVPRVWSPEVSKRGSPQMQVPICRAPLDHEAVLFSPAGKSRPSEKPLTPQCASFSHPSLH